MSKFKKYSEWLNEDSDENLNESLGAENTTPPVNDDLEDIRFFRGGVAQLNDWLNKKLESQNKTWNPYSDMQYKYPVERNEKDDSIGYQDYNHGKDSAPENAKATRRRGSKVDPAKFPSSLDEASRSKVFKAAKKGSYPVTLVAIDNGKVVHQELARTPEIVPAAFNVLQIIIKKKHPNAKIRVEDNTGKLLFVESAVNEATDAWHDTKHNYEYDPESTTTIEGTPLKNGITMRQFMKLWKKDLKLEKKIGGSPDGSLVNYYAEQSYEMAAYLYNEYGFDFEVEFYRSAWNYGGHITPTYYLKGPWETRKAPIQINTGRAGSTGSVSFYGILDGVDMTGAGYRSTRVEAGVHYSWQVYPVRDMSELFEIIYKSFQRTYDMEMTAKNMATLGKGFVKLRKAWMKIWGTGGKLDKAYEKFTDLRPRKNFGIYYSSPSLYPKYVKWYIDLPREFRHPDEYGGQDNWSDEKWEMQAAEEKVSSIISNFCDKYGIDATITADK